MEKTVEISKALLLLLLPLPSLVILKPIEHILALNVAINPKPSCDLLNLLCSWGPQTLPVQALKHVYLFLGGVPS